jgi:DNA replication protein DnaC
MAGQGRIAGPNSRNESVHICGLTPFLRVGLIPHWSKQNYDAVWFTSAMSLVATLTKASAENRLEERLKQYGRPKLLIIDEIGYIPIDQHGAHLFFPLISRRYERGAIMLTSNQSFGQWAEVFGNPIIATAILDRLLHHSVVINSKGASHRLREKQKAGLLKTPEPTLAS